MTIPDFESIMLPLLKCVKDGKEWSMNDVVQSLEATFQLNENEKTQLKPSSTTETVFENRARWARLYLKKANLLIDPKRSYTKITSEGIKVLEKNPEKINNDFLMQFESFTAFKSRKKEKNDQFDVIVVSPKSPEDLIIDGFTEIRQDLENEILEKIKDNPPDFFEKLVVELLEKMGYGRGTVNGKSGDGGIDGMLQQDNLGLDEIYLQAKRWKGTVPGKEIRDFAGVLDAKKSKKGIFITTSDFSNEAREFVKQTTSKIILINGEKLASLMFENNLGFQPGDTYQLKKIDEEYFS